MSLDGKTILITGAARRIGRHLAISLAKLGADIVIHYGHSLAEARTTANEISSLGKKSWLIQADLNDPEQAAQIVTEAAKHTNLYALINNASRFDPVSFTGTSLSAWQDHMNINLTAPFLLSQAFAGSLSPGSPGRIVNMLDWRALRPNADHFPYTISKVGLAGMTQSLAVALAPNITVNGIALGAILPPSDQSDASGVLKDVPAGRWANLDEVTQTTLYFLDGPSYITGEIVHLDGGRHLI